eukprot:jgi/Mesvir1/26361/Mv16072-RA.1
MPSVTTSGGQEKEWAEWAEYFFSPGPDKRVKDYYFMEPWQPLLLTAVYLLFVFGGYSFMKRRQPFQLRAVSLVHNAFLLCLSLYMVVETASQAYLNFHWRETGFRPFCQPVEGLGDDTWQTESGRRLARVLWIHYLSKGYEFLDTVIIILKKNDKQLNFLHVYHHATTFFPVWYLNVRYGPGGEAWFVCFLNSLVHVFMYAHYFLSSLGDYPGKRYFRKFITRFQLVQFGMYLFECAVLLSKDCFRPRISVYQLLFQSIIFVILFSNFYSQNYSSRTKRALEQEALAQAQGSKLKES